MSRHVKGVLFVDYVRMVRGHKGVDWAHHLDPEDLPYLHQHIEPDGWYPMASFERLGNAILRFVAGDQLYPVRMWGRLSVDQLRARHPELLAHGDPIESLRRFRNLRSTFFDFEALDVLMLHEGESRIAIAYHMGMPAEEAAAHQTAGFFERLLELAGAGDVRAALIEQSWAGAPRTLLELAWHGP